jgi:hypothetical protein
VNIICICILALSHGAVMVLGCYTQRHWLSTGQANGAQT